MKIHWLLSSLTTLSILLVSLSAKAAELQSWQFNERQNQLTFSTDEPVQPRVQLLDDPVRLVIDLPNTALEKRHIDEDGDGAIEEIDIRRMDDNVARIVIELEDNYRIDPAQVVVRGTSPTDWVVQLPTPQRSQRQERRSNRSEEGTPIAVKPYVEATIIEAVELSADGSSLEIRADQPIQTYTSGWDQSTATYQIQIPQARLARGVSSPTLDNRSALLQARVRQEGDAVVIALQPAPGVQIGNISRLNQIISLSFLGRPQRRFSGASNVVRRPLPPLNQLPNVAEKRVLIALDPGHGGRDPGAVGIGGLRETDIVLEVGLKVAQLLQQQGAQVVLTRQDEREIDLEPRVSTANRANADLFVSIHANAISMSRPDVNGVETYYYSSAAAEELASSLQESVLDATGMNSRGVKEARFYVLRRTNMPAALIEVGFVTGADDAPRLADSSFRDLLAQAITRGILQYVVNNF